MGIKKTAAAVKAEKRNAWNYLLLNFGILGRVIEYCA